MEVELEILNKIHLLLKIFDNAKVYMNDFQHFELLH